MTGWLFGTLDIYLEDNGWSHSAAMNMAIDEVLLETASFPSIRFYRWSHPALSFGYFGKFADVENFATERDLVRRWTGGGIVFHGEDLTYSIVIPANDSAFDKSSLSIYESVHRALSNALSATGTRTELASAPSGRISKSCFASPVRADVMLNGRKIAGAAQRRTRRGLLQQGSIQQVGLADNFAQRFVHQLAGRCAGHKIEKSVLDRAETIAAQKYVTETWLQKR